VGQKLANPWGLVDMAGNIWEWCHDWYGPYPGGSVTNPQGVPTGSSRVVPGGSWFILPTYCRSAQRFSRDPTTAESYYGFRVVLAPN
jgi:formylglycine-generating enzyme required for sulfatase activity